ncbi:hypothetical protein ACH437_09025 [Streptomyces xinghaiensis]|uniref:hypothetical protein n=1 Tax=Streptomyces xinghaiensis TaxID=1038928 RepID=UPI0037B1F6DF
MTAVEMPTWLAQELAQAIAGLPAQDALLAHEVLARGEHTVERWPCGGVEAWAVDVGALELLTCPPEGERL